MAVGETHQRLIIHTIVEDVVGNRDIARPRADPKSETVPEDDLQGLLTPDEAKVILEPNEGILVDTERAKGGTQSPQHTSARTER